MLSHVCGEHHFFGVRVFECVVFIFEQSFPGVLPLLSSCLMYHSFRWGVAAVELYLSSENWLSPTATPGVTYTDTSFDTRGKCVIERDVFYSAELDIAHNSDQSL